MKIGIIGGGFTGLMLAERLSNSGHNVVVYEKSEQLGGLATYHDYGSFVWDRFYHVILPSDNFLIDYLREIGLGHKLKWNETFTGFYIDQKFYSMSNSLEFLFFPPLNLLNKIRLAFTILYCSKIKDWQSLENIPLEEWLIRIGGRKTYEKLWLSLLRAKLGEHYRRASAVFIWSYIKRSFSARNSSAKKEQLGYVQGSYKMVFDHMKKLITSKGGEIRTGVLVEGISTNEDNQLVIKSNAQKEIYDKVIATSPVNVLKKITDKSLLEFSNDHHTVEYLGVICMVLVTRKPLTPYYVLNIADPSIPFTGVIGMSTVAPPQETAGYHLTYLPKYIHTNDELWHLNNDDVMDLFFTGFNLMFPNFIKSDIVSVHINRAQRVQPLQVLNYSSLIPDVTTKHDDFYVVNTSQFVSDTLNNNTVAQHVKEFLDEQSIQFEQSDQLQKSKIGEYNKVRPHI